MTEPLPFDDAALDRLLARHASPPLGAGFADRVVAEAGRADRAPTFAPAAPPRRATRRWTRRGIWAGVVAVNLIVASAIAATFGGGHFHLARVVAVVSHALHLPHHETPAPHRALAVHARAAPSRVLAASAPGIAPAEPRVAAPAAIAAPPPIVAERVVVRPFATRPVMTRPFVAARRPTVEYAHAAHVAAVRARVRARVETSRPPAAIDRPALAAPLAASPRRELDRSLAAPARGERAAIEPSRADRAAPETQRGERFAPWRGRAQAGQNGDGGGRGWWRRRFADTAPATGEREGAGATSGGAATAPEAMRRDGGGLAANGAASGAGNGPTRAGGSANGGRAGGKGARAGGWRGRFGRGRRR